MGMPILRTMFSSLYIVDRAGRMKVLLDSNGLRHPASTCPIGPMSSSRSANSDPSSRRCCSREHTANRSSRSPIRSSAVDGIKGLLAGSLDLTRRDLLVSLVDPGSGSDDALRVVSDGEGRILAHPNPALVHVAACRRAPPGGGSRDAGRRAAAPSNRVRSRSSSRPVSSPPAVCPVPTGWCGARSDEQQVFAPLHAARDAMRSLGGRADRRQQPAGARHLAHPAAPAQARPGTGRPAARPWHRSAARLAAKSAAKSAGCRGCCARSAWNAHGSKTPTTSCCSSSAR